MEKQTQISVTPKAPRSKELLVGLGILAVMFVVGLVWLSMPVDAKDEYALQYELAEQAFNTELYNICLLLKDKGKARLMDDANGIDTGSFDRNNTAKYRDMDCAEVVVKVSVDF